MGWWIVAGLLRTDRVPAFDQEQQVIDVGGAVMVDITLADPQLCMKLYQVVRIDITIAVEVTSWGGGVVNLLKVIEVQAT